MLLSISLVLQALDVTSILSRTTTILSWPTTKKSWSLKPVKALFFALNLDLPVLADFSESPSGTSLASSNASQPPCINLATTCPASVAPSSQIQKIEDTRKDILSLLVKSNDFTDHELAHQVLTFLAAGHETTSSTLSWCIYLLAQHPEIQNELRNEIRSALPSPSTLCHLGQKRRR